MDAHAATTASGSTNPLASKPPHHPPKAKSIIFLYLHGGMSHVDTFDPKPKLTQMDGKPLPFAKPKFTFAKTGNLMKSPWKFSKYGQSGIEVSELFPHIGGVIDDICVIRSMVGRFVAHGGAGLELHTGAGIFVRPSMGAWILYGLGTVSQNLPGFITLSPSPFHGGAQNYGSAFLPAVYQGTRIGDGDTPFTKAKIPNLSGSSDQALQRRQLDLLKKWNDRHLADARQDARLEARIESFELAFRMQRDAPAVMDLSQESPNTFQLYGIGQEPTDDFGQQCLMARRLAERGVRFIQVSHSHPRNYWDQHGGLRAGHGRNAVRVDKPIAGLITDLKQRGMLDQTLVILGTEFGRSPAAQSKDGRDHNPFGFSMWMAGGGIKGGITYGATDEFGWYAVQKKVVMHDLHATMLHLLGLDHTRLIYHHAGRDFRLTDIDGHVLKEIIV